MLHHHPQVRSLATGLVRPSVVGQPWPPGEHRQVHTRAEVLAGRRHHDRPGRSAGVELTHDRGQLGPEGRGHRVQLLGPLQLEIGDLVGDGDVEALVHRGDGT